MRLTISGLRITKYINIYPTFLKFKLLTNLGPNQGSKLAD